MSDEIKRWWLDTRAHSAPRARGETNRFTAWRTKPAYLRIHGSLADAAKGRLIEVMPVQEHEMNLSSAFEALEKTQKMLSYLKIVLRHVHGQPFGSWDAQAVYIQTVLANVERGFETCEACGGVRDEIAGCGPCLRNSMKGKDE